MSASALPHLIVDGSNLIHAWDELRALAKRDRETARERLVRMLTVLHDAGDLRLTVVFDGRGAELVVEHPLGQPSLTCVYTPSGSTADDVIEQMVGRTPEPAGCLVATGDQAERGTIEALGAVWCPPDDLRARVERAEAQGGARVKKLAADNTQKWRAAR